MHAQKFRQLRLGAGAGDLFDALQLGAELVWQGFAPLFKNNCNIITTYHSWSIELL